MSTPPPNVNPPNGGYPPNPGYGQQPYGAAPYGQPPQPEPKKKKKWPWIVGGIVALLVIVGACSGGSGDSTGTSSTSTKSTEESASGSDPSESQESTKAEGSGSAGTDVSQGETVDMDGMQVTVSNVRTESDALSSYVCSDVTLQNNSGKQKSFSQFDFKLAKPNGVIADSTFTGLPTTNLESADLADGGQTSGTVCFDSDGASGEYKVEYSGNIFSSKKATWSATL